MSWSKNHLNRRSYSRRSQNWRSERTEYSAISTLALSRLSGGIEGRPRREYISLNTGERLRSARSTISLIALIGWSCGTLWSGATNTITAACPSSSPRMYGLPAARHAYTTADFFSTLLGQHHASAIYCNGLTS